MTLDSYNLEYQKKRLILAALNKAGTVKDAAKLLGVDSSNLSRLKLTWNIKKTDGRFSMPAKILYSSIKQETC